MIHRKIEKLKILTQLISLSTLIFTNLNPLQQRQILAQTLS